MGGTLECLWTGMSVGGKPAEVSDTARWEQVAGEGHGLTAFWKQNYRREKAVKIGGKSQKRRNGEYAVKIGGKSQRRKKQLHLEAKFKKEKRRKR